MKILVAHNAYQQRGGEDAVVASEVALLRARGHEVFEYQRHNDELAHIGRLRAAADSLWSRRTVAELHAIFQQAKPDVVHAHNTFPLISPSLYWAAAQARVPVVQTLHNFRLLCPQAMLLRDGQVCESCLGRTPWPGVVHACYRQSTAQSATLAAMLVLHRGLGTWAHKVTRYIALNDFCRAKFVEGGLPADRIVVKPNFVEDPGAFEAPRQGLLFVGRLSPEKGVAVLADAAASFAQGVLRVAGDGPMADRLRGCPGATLLGALAPAAVTQEMSRALALLLPSIWYENFPRTVVEAFACGLPVIASRIGALAGIVEDGVTGLLFEPGNANDLAARCTWALENPDRMAAMGRAARSTYERHYTPALNYLQLMQVYKQAMGAVG
jgi:glycosyltransferase involved in cell wall biosynthesis